MTQTGRSESIAASSPTLAALGTHARKPGADGRDLSPQRRFNELLRRAKVRPSQNKNLMGSDAGRDRIEAEAQRRDARKSADDARDDARVQADNAVAVVNSDIKSSNQVDGTRDRAQAAAAGQTGATGPAGNADAADSGRSAAIAALLEAATQAQDDQNSVQTGSGPGNQRGVPPGGGGLNGQGPETGSITQVEATDVSRKNGSQPQGPGATLAPLALDDLQLVHENRHPQGGAAGDGQSQSDSDVADAAIQASTAGSTQSADSAAASTFNSELAKVDAVQSPAHGPATAHQPTEASRQLQIDNPADPAPLRSAIVDHIEQSTKGGAQSIRLVLNPEHLGEVQIRVTLVNGVVNATLRVENPAVSEAVQHQLESLRAALVDQGIKIDKLEVSVSGDSDRRQQEDAYAGGNFGQGGHARSDGQQDGTWSLPRAYRQVFGDNSADEPEPIESAAVLSSPAADRPAGLDVRA